ncbi:MAG TPA: HAD hydrolase-like protein [Pirellulales bacterium]|jgi:phosphonatase-like hydrolase|nr:HAD hydrolase-like protein [Pirellulales bacterium]
MMRIDLVIFDIAGTTVNDDDGVNRCVRAALENVGLVTTREAVNQVMGIPKPQALRHLIEQSDRRAHLLSCLDAIHADFVARMMRFYRTDPSVHEIAGASDTFLRLHAAGIKTALNTGFTRDVVDVLLDRLNWTDGVVHSIVTSDEVPRGRPYPDMIRKIMSDLGVADPGRVAKVGDTPADLQEGTNAGCGLVIGVTQGSHTAAQLQAFNPSYLIDTVADLPALLKI